MHACVYKYRSTFTKCLNFRLLYTLLTENLIFYYSVKPIRCSHFSCGEVKRKSKYLQNQQESTYCTNSYIQRPRYCICTTGKSVVLHQLLRQKLDWNITHYTHEVKALRKGTSLCHFFHTFNKNSKWT